MLIDKGSIVSAYIRSLSDETLNALPSVIKEEKEKRMFERTRDISQSKIHLLQKELYDILDLTDDKSPDQFIVKFSRRAYVYYSIREYTNVVAAVEFDDIDTETVDENNEVDILSKKSVKTKIDKLQKRWTELVNKIKSIAAECNVSESDIWDIVDKKGML